MRKLFRYAVAATVTAAQVTMPAQAIIAPNIPRERQVETAPDVAVAQVVNCILSTLPDSEQQVATIQADQNERRLSVVGVVNGGATIYEYFVANGMSLYTRQTPGETATVMTVEAGLPAGHPMKGKEATMNRPNVTFTPMRPETQARIDGMAHCVGIDAVPVPGLRV